MKISQVFPGGGGTPNLEYAELEMTAAGQNVFVLSNATVTLRAPAGTVTRTIELNANPAFGERGRRILVGSAGTSALDDVAIAFGQPPDFTFPAGGYLAGTGGAACFAAPAFGVGDCVSWGSFTGSTPFPTGGPTPAIALNNALDRRRCGAGLVDSDKPGDWTQLSPGPFNNAASPAASTPCPNTTITKKPPKRTTQRKATFKFSATMGVSTFACKLDNGAFRPCNSGAFSKRVKVGRHTFSVRATGDLSPATYKWTVKRRR